MDFRTVLLDVSSFFECPLFHPLPSLPPELDILLTILCLAYPHTLPSRPFIHSEMLPVQSNPFSLTNKSFRRMLAPLVFIHSSLSLADLHLGQLGSGSTSDLLNPQRSKLSLELVKLSHEVLLVPIY